MRTHKPVIILYPTFIIICQGIPTTMDDLMMGVSVDWPSSASRGFKARIMVIGDPGVQNTVQYNELNQDSSIPRLRPSIQAFASWLQRRFNASHPAYPPYALKDDSAEPRRLINVVLIVRGTTKRRLINMNEVLKVFQSYPNIIARAQVLEELSVAQQVCLSSKDTAGIHAA